MQQLVWRMLAAVMLSLASIVTAQEVCLDGQLRLSTVFVQYCYNGEWRFICHQDSDWNQQRTNDACTQLGYTYKQNESGTSNDVCITTPQRVVTVTNCIGSGLTQCTVTPSDTCTTCSHVRLDCTTDTIRPSCPGNGSLRLVGGSTEREGRVEVCVGNRWRTVCTDNSQQLAGAVCSLLGCIFEESAVAAVNTFSRGTVPEYELNCVLPPTGALTCEPLREQCSSPVELGVVCKNCENLYNESSMETITTAQTTIAGNGSSTTDSSTTGGSAADSSLIAGIAILVVLLVAVVVGWTVSCIILLRRQTGKKQNHIPRTTLGNTNGHFNETRIDEHTYDAATAMSGDSYSKLNRGPAQSDTIADVTYAEPDQIRGPSPATDLKKPPKIAPYQPDHPPPVGGVSEDQFYNAEVHTYSAVKKKKASLDTVTP